MYVLPICLTNRKFFTVPYLLIAYQRKKIYSILSDVSKSHMNNKIGEDHWSMEIHPSPNNWFGQYEWHLNLILTVLFLCTAKVNGSCVDHSNDYGWMQTEEPWKYSLFLSCILCVIVSYRTFVLWSGSVYFNWLIR